MENLSAEGPPVQEIKTEMIINVKNELFNYSPEFSPDFIKTEQNEQDPPILHPNYTNHKCENVSRNSIGETLETSEDCSQTPLKKRKYCEYVIENNNKQNSSDCTEKPISPETQNKEQIKKRFKCRFCSYHTTTEVAFTMHLLQHVTGQSNTENESQNNQEIIEFTNSLTNTDEENSTRSISITITAPKSSSSGDLKQSIVNEILRKLGFANENINEETNKNINKEPETTTSKTIDNEEPKKLKTYARKSKTTPIKTSYFHDINTTFDSNNIDNDQIMDSNQLLINPTIIEQLNEDQESTYHILKNVIHAQIDGSGYDYNNHYETELDINNEEPNNEHSLFGIEPAYMESIVPAQPEPATPSTIQILSNISITSSFFNNDNTTLLEQQEIKQPDKEIEYQCIENKVQMPTDKNFGKNLDFQCQYCPTKTAPEEKHFRLHYRMHFTKKGIQCPFCTYRSMKSNVVKHLFCHTPCENNVYKCPLCDIEKTNKETLTDHLKVVHSKELFSKHDSVCRSWFCRK